MNKKNSSEKPGTDWEKLRNMKDEDIDFSDIPKAAPNFFARAVVRKNFKPILKNVQENLPIDRDIIEYFKNQGENYQAQINRLLRSYMENHQNK